MPKGGLKPRKLCKMPGLPKRPFLENAVKRPDSIRGIYIAHSARGARCAVFMIWVNFPFGKRGWTEWRGSEKKARQNAIRGSGGHYIRPDLRPFWGLGRAVGPACRRWEGFTTVAGGGGIPYGLRVRSGIFREVSGKQNFSRFFFATIFLKIFSGKPGKNKKLSGNFWFQIFEKFLPENPGDGKKFRTRFSSHARKTCRPGRNWPAPGFPVMTAVLIGPGCVVLAGSGWYVRRWGIRRRDPALFREYN